MLTTSRLDRKQSILTLVKTGTVHLQGRNLVAMKQGRWINKSPKRLQTASPRWNLQYRNRWNTVWKFTGSLAKPSEVAMAVFIIRRTMPREGGRQMYQFRMACPSMGSNENGHTHSHSRIFIIFNRGGHSECKMDLYEQKNLRMDKRDYCIKAYYINQRHHNSSGELTSHTTTHQWSPLSMTILKQFNRHQGFVTTNYI